MSIRTAGGGDYLATDDGERSLTGGEIGGLGQGDAFSVIDRHSNFDGTFRSDRDLRIEGEVKGTIECKGTLFVAQGANVTAKIEAENVTVAGDLNGDIRCRGRLQMMPSGRVRGKVNTETLVINEGAYYEGQLEMVPPEERGTGSVARTATSSGTPPVPMPGLTGESRAAAGGQGSGAGTTASSTTFIRRLGGPETPWEAGADEDEDEEPAPRET